VSERGSSNVFVSYRRSPAFEGLLRELETELLSREAERSLWLNQVVAAKIVQDPDRALSTALRNLEAMEADALFENPWVERWRIVLQRGPDAAVAVLVSRHPEAVEMRQNAPFAGVIGSRERAKVLDAFRRHWRSLHTTGPGEAPVETGESVAQ
jgi:hypothetical protein